MKKIKVFYADRLTTELDKKDTMDLMNDEVNRSIADWVAKNNIKDYEIVNSHLTSVSEFKLYGQFNASSIILATHISYEG